MRRIIIICCTCAAFILLVGCWDRRETNDLAIVTGVGLDKNNDGKIEITVEIHSPGGAGGSDGNGKKGNQMYKTILRTGKGLTIPDAIEELDIRLPREILWSHAEVIVISKAFAETGIREELDFFVRHPQPRMRSFVFISKGKAKDIMGLRPPLERSVSELLIELAKSEVLLKVTLLDLMEMLKGESDASILPMIDKLPPQQGKSPLETIAYINRSAVLKKGKMIGSINDQITRGVLWFRDEIQESIVTVKPEDADGFISLNLLNGRTDLIPIMDGSPLKMKVKIDTVDDVIQNQTNWDLKKLDKVKMLEKELAQRIENRLTDTLDKVQKELEADVIGFAEEFRRGNPEKWKEIKGSWNEIFPTIKVDFDVDAKVLRTGKGSAS